MNKEWQERLLGLRHRSTREEDLEYVTLVDEAHGKADYETAKILMKTFVDDDDGGVQESVLNVLYSSPPEIYIRAILEELQRLVRDVPGWSDMLIAREVESRTRPLFIEIAKSYDNDTKQLLLEVMESDTFTYFQDKTSQVIDALTVDGQSSNN